MKKVCLIIFPVFLAISSFSQYVYKIKADSVLITNDSCSAELNIENSTRNVCGFLFNKGNGRTEFRSALIKLNDSTYVSGCDTLKLHNNSGGGGAVAFNGLSNAVTGTDSVRLGGTLNQNTIINGDIYKLSLSGRYISDSDALLNVTHSGTRTGQNGVTNRAAYFKIIKSGVPFNTTDVAVDAYAADSIPGLSGGAKVGIYAHGEQGSNHLNPGYGGVFQGQSLGLLVMSPDIVFNQTTLFRSLSAFVTTNPPDLSPSLVAHFLSTVPSGDTGTVVRISGNVPLEGEWLNAGANLEFGLTNTGSDGSAYRGMTLNKIVSKNIRFQQFVDSRVSTQMLFVGKRLDKPETQFIIDTSGITIPDGIMPTSGSEGIDSVVYRNSATGQFYLAPGGGGGSGGSVRLDQIAAATGGASLDNGNNAIGWSWNSLDNQALTLSSISTTATGNNQKVLAIDMGGVNAASAASTRGIIITNSHSGSSSTNYGIDISAYNATTNYGINSEVIGAGAAGRFKAYTINTPAILIDSGFFEMKRMTAPGTPSANFGRLYSKSDGKIYFKNDAGTEYDLTDNGGGGGGGGTVTSITTASPLNGGIITTTGTIGINDAAADGTTKGAASFAGNDFNASSGNITIDYTNGQKASSSIPGFATSNQTTGTIGLTVDGQGATVSTGSKGFVTIPYNCIIANWYVSASASGSIQFDIKRSGTSIVGSGNKPLLSSSQSGSAAASGWTSVSVSEGDILEWVIDSATTITNATVVLKVYK